jgi:coenzyme F420-reducing hydrogenase alpha subunit
MTARNRLPTRTIKVDYLARVEGEGAIYIRFRGDQVTDVKLRIYEPPRFFEALLRGRRFTEAPDITARICGICPIAYQMTSVQAMERAYGARVDGPLRELRRLIYLGEWIESHALHIYLLHAPDFLGYPGAVEMARDHRGAVERGLQLKKVGNELMTLLGGREIHPINLRVGGFYRVPARAELEPIRARLQWALEAARETVHWVAGFPFPRYEQDYEFVSLRHPTEYPIVEGRVVSSRGLDVEVSDYESYFEEEHVEHSNALHSSIRGGGAYLVGPMARYSLNFDQLPDSVKLAAHEAGMAPVCRNPFQSVVVRALEVMYACEEAIRIIESYRPPEAPAVPVPPRQAIGMACTEAPRGLIYHRYALDAEGIIQEARIVPPTSQNQKTIEADLRGFVERNHTLPLDELTRRCEQATRNYDPCISCATHFLKLHVEHEL